MATDWFQQNQPSQQTASWFQTNAPNAPQPIARQKLRQPVGTPITETLREGAIQALSPIAEFGQKPILGSFEERANAFLLPPASGAGPLGSIGTLSDFARTAYKFIDFLQTPTGAAATAATALSGGAAAPILAPAFLAQLAPEAVNAYKQYEQTKSPEDLQNFLMTSGMTALVGAGAKGIPEAGRRLGEMKRIDQRFKETQRLQKATEGVEKAGEQWQDVVVEPQRIRKMATIEKPAEPVLSPPSTREFLDPDAVPKGLLPEPQDFTWVSRGEVVRAPGETEIRGYTRPGEQTVTPTPRPVEPFKPPERGIEPTPVPVQPAKITKNVPIKATEQEVYPGAKGKTAKNIAAMEQELSKESPETVTDARRFAQDESLDPQAYSDYLEFQLAKAKWKQKLPERASKLAKVFSESPKTVADTIDYYARQAKASEGGSFDPASAFDRAIDYAKNKKKLREGLSGSTLQAGIDPTLLSAAVKVGVYELRIGAKEFSKWSSRMIEQVGDKIKPYLRQIYAQSVKEHAELNRPERMIADVTNKIVQDVETIKSTGTISEPIKPEVRGEARKAFEGQNIVVSEKIVDSARANLVLASEQLKALREQTKEFSSPAREKALSVAEEQARKLAEELARIRRGAGLTLRRFQETGFTEQQVKEMQANLPKDVFDQIAALTEGMKQLEKPSLHDKFYEFWINSLLSGPLTHTANSASNLLVRLSTPAEKGLAGVVDYLRSRFTGSEQQRFMGEAAADIYGAIAGFRDGIAAGLESFKTEQPILGETRIEAPRRTAIEGTKGRVIRTPGRLLLAADEMMKAINHSAELQSLAFRTAVSEGKAGQARAERIAQLVKAEPKEIAQEALANTFYRVFQQPLGPTSAAAMRLRNSATILRYIVPFLKTPVNIAKYALERTPVNFLRLAKMYRDGKLGKGELSTELAKPILGTAIGALTTMLASEGYITGSGPKDEDARRVLYEAGWQPYSIKIGSRYYSFSRVEPIGSLLGLAADAYEAFSDRRPEERSNAASKIVQSVSRNITSKTYLTGVVETFDAISDPDRNGDRYLSRFAGTLIPTGGAQLARATDPFFRRPRGITETLKSRIPGLSKSVEPRYGVFGQESERGGSFAEKLLSPFYVSDIKNDPIAKEMVRLGMSVGEPSRRLTVDGQDVDLNQEEYKSLVKQAGSESKIDIGYLMASPDYKAMSDEEKREAIQELIREARSRARKDIGASPEVLDRVFAPIP